VYGLLIRKIEGIMKDIKNGKLVKVGQTANKMQIKTGNILWLEKETIKNILAGKGKCLKETILYITNSLK
tara:strand:+ start:528 stop:737 length:210 start_codon:yes stop_codon:yes gene_type:complete